MSRGGRAARAAGGSVLALLAALAWLAARPACCDAPAAAGAFAGAPPAPALAPALARTSADADADARAGAAPHAPAAAPAHEAGLRGLLQRPPSALRESVLQAQARHGDGGRLYARYLLRQCAAAASVAGLHAPEGDDPGRLAPPDAADPRAARALARVQQLRAACEQFTPAELASGTNIGAGDGAADDPLLVQLDRFGATPADERAQRQRLLAHPDPLLLQEIGPRLALHAAAGEQAYWFDGQRVSPDVAEPALALLPCALGLPCDERDPLVWLSCLQGRTCAATRAELVLQQAAPDDAARQQQILALARRMGQAVLAADADRFAMPAAPGG